jgi:hypothetical protein
VVWTPITEGEAIAFSPGNAYAIVASVKATHTASEIRAMAAARGLTLTDYAEEGERPGLGPDPRGPAYRYVAAAGNASAAGSLPWGVPWPVSLFDGSEIVRAWSAPGRAPPTVPPPGPPAPSRAASQPSLVPLMAIFAGLGLLAWMGR